MHFDKIIADTLLTAMGTLDKFPANRAFFPYQ